MRKPTQGQVKTVIEREINDLIEDFDPTHVGDCLTRTHEPLSQSEGEDWTAEHSASSGTEHPIGLPHTADCSLYEDFRAMAVFEHYHRTRPQDTHSPYEQAAISNMISIRLDEWSVKKEANASLLRAHHETFNGLRRVHLQRCKPCDIPGERTVVEFQVRNLRRSYLEWLKLQSNAHADLPTASRGGGTSATSSEQPSRVIDDLLRRLAACGDLREARDAVRESEALLLSESGDTEISSKTRTAERSELAERTGGAFDTIAAWVRDDWNAEELPTWRTAVEAIWTRLSGEGSTEGPGRDESGDERQAAHERQATDEWHATDERQATDEDYLTLSSSAFEEALRKRPHMKEYDLDFEWESLETTPCT